jgi:hypothetical protein
VNFSISDPSHTHGVTVNNAANGGAITAGGGATCGSAAAATITVANSFTNIIVASGGSGTPLPLLPPGEVQGITLIRAG